MGPTSGQGGASARHTRALATVVEGARIPAQARAPQAVRTSATSTVYRPSHEETSSTRGLWTVGDHTQSCDRATETVVVAQRPLPEATLTPLSTRSRHRRTCRCRSFSYLPLAPALPRSQPGDGTSMWQEILEENW